MRLYVPATLDELAAVTVGELAAPWTLGPRAAHAVTAALRSALPDEDDEGLEYVAALDAADASLALIAARPGAAPQRLVVTVDVPDGAVESARGHASDAGGKPGAGQSGGESSDAGEGDEMPASAVWLARTLADVPVVCVHVDEPEAADDVRAVLEATDPGTGNPGGSGSRGADADTGLDAAIERVTERDLLWYDWSELGTIPRV